MKKCFCWLIFVLMSSALILIFGGGLATAAEEKYPTVFKKEAPKKAEEELFITPEVTSQSGVQSEVDAALLSQGLYFTPGGVRPIEPGQGGGFPDVSNIYFIQNKSPK